MARFEPTDLAHKEALKARAEKLKPNAFNLVATARGWEQSRPNGTLELLVCFAGLDELLGDNAPAEVVGEPVEVVVPTVVEETAKETVVDATPPVETKPAEVVKAPAKKTGGRPKKVVEDKAAE
jgi:hypothetical protein